MIDTIGYDVITGYRADDSYFSFAQDFLNGSISYKQLCRAMYLGKLCNQIVLKSRKAFEKIKFIDFIEIDKDIYYPLKENRDRLTRREYLNNERNKGEITVLGCIYNILSINITISVKHPIDLYCLVVSIVATSATII